MAAPVEADAAEALRGKLNHLIIPHLASESEAAEEQHWRTLTPFPPIELGPIWHCHEWHIDTHD
jgi:hypothetical protein